MLLRPSKIVLAKKAEMYTVRISAGIPDVLRENAFSTTGE
jgi:hypothetical protein